jgi:hypothetical protein
VESPTCLDKEISEREVELRLNQQESDLCELRRALPRKSLTKAGDIV